MERNDYLSSRHLNRRKANRATRIAHTSVSKPPSRNSDTTDRCFSLLAASVSNRAIWRFFQMVSVACLVPPANKAPSEKARAGQRHSGAGDMDTTTLLIVLVILIIVAGGGWHYGRGRWF
jgi:hypothetical protein